MDENSIPQTTSLSRTHAEFLEQLNDEEFWKYAANTAHSSPSLDQPFEEYLVCDLGATRSILPIGTLRAIVAPPHLYSLLPASPTWMCGIMAWRGTAIAVIDLEAYLSNTVAQPRPESMLLVAQQDDITLGLLATIVGYLPADLVEPIAQSAYDAVSPCMGTIQWVYKGKSGKEVERREDAVILDIPAILTDVVQQVRMTPSYG